MKLKYFLELTFCIILMSLLSSCVSMIGAPQTRKVIDVPIIVYNQAVPQVFKDIDKTISVRIESNISQESMYDMSAIPEFYQSSQPRYNFVPDIKTFATEATTEHMQKMRFDLSSSGDYWLCIDISSFRLRWINFKKRKMDCTVALSYRLTNDAGETIIPSKTVSATIEPAENDNFGIVMGRAYAAVLNKIDWKRIAGYLQGSEQEENEKVKGNGTTTMEKTVVRWYITSNPSGADITWRVLSSTSDVQNSNSNFIGTTPFESTENFDIKGLSYNNSGNVQIEISCEKRGYITQRKRFNLKQVIEQKEISTKFNLIKDE